jgi:DNA-directed RNA polymerase subunit A"
METYIKEQLDLVNKDLEIYRKPIIYAPFNLANIINQFSDNGDPASNDEKATLIKKFIDTDTEIYGKFGPIHEEIYKNNVRLIEILIWKNLFPEKLSVHSLVKILSEIEKFMLRGIVSPGENHGPVSSTAIASIITQMTLNTFHASGGVGIAGMDRLEDLLMISEKSKDTSSLLIYFKDNSEDKMNLVQKKLSLVSIEKIIKKKTLLYEEKFPKSTIYEGDILPEITIPLPKFNIRLEFDKSKMFDSLINIEDVVYAIMKKYPITYCIIINEVTLRIGIMDISGDVYHTAIDLYNDIDFLLITGIDGIVRAEKTEVTVQHKGETKKEKILMSIGTNIFDVMRLPDIDHERTISTYLPEIYEYFGIECARSMLFRFIYTLFMQKDLSIFPGHIDLLCDGMTCTGGFVKIHDAGIKKLPDVEPAQKYTFERPLSHLKDSCLKNESDNMRGVSINSALCQKGPYGTGAFELYVN